LVQRTLTLSVFRLSRKGLFRQMQFTVRVWRGPSGSPLSLLFSYPPCRVGGDRARKPGPQRIRGRDSCKKPEDKAATRPETKPLSNVRDFRARGNPAPKSAEILQPSDGRGNGSPFRPQGNSGSGFGKKTETSGGGESWKASNGGEGCGRPRVDPIPSCSVIAERPGNRFRLRFSISPGRNGPTNPPNLKGSLSATSEKSKVDVGKTGRMGARPPTARWRSWLMNP